MRFVQTGVDGSFELADLAIRDYDLYFTDPLGAGIAARSVVGLFPNIPFDLGDVVLDGAPPEVVAIDPADAATGVSTTRVIAIDSSEPIDAATVSAQTVQVRRRRDRSRARSCSRDGMVIQSDRGGQVTYHGPGQIVGYLMFDVRRMGINVRELVTGIENAVVALLASYGIRGEPRPDAPGVYVDGAKIAALGLRVRRGCSYHGLSLNVDMDLEPFSRINPCGLQGMEVTQMADLVEGVALRDVEDRLLDALAAAYRFNFRRLGKTGFC